MSRVWTDTVDPGTSLEEWIEPYCVAHENRTCGATESFDSSDFGPVRPSGIREWHNPTGEPMAAFLSGDTVYVLAIWRSENDPSVGPWGGSRRLLEAFITTMRLTEPAASPAAT